MTQKKYKEFWCDPNAKVIQFLGQDNVFFYVIMQGSMWLGQQADPHRQPAPGDLQMTDILSCFHLQVNGEKMSKSTGNYYTADQLLEMGYAPDQVRYFLSMLSLPAKASNFDFDQFHERNKFLAGPMNAAFEKPISACHSKFGGRVPDGRVLEKIEQRDREACAEILALNGKRRVRHFAWSNRKLRALGELDFYAV